MTRNPAQEQSRIVVVVGVDLSNLSAHLLAQTRDLVRTVDEAEIHVVHVVRPEPTLMRLARPLDAPDAGVVSAVDRAQRVVAQLCASLVGNPGTRVIVHTPVGDPVELLARIAYSVGAQVLVVEAHDRNERAQHGLSHLFHRSMVDRITAIAPCTVLTIRTPAIPVDDVREEREEAAVSVR
jgi:nucleotide-binding universal stress UspA family protein